MNTNLITYYKDRAKEYEKIYSKPERQEDLAKGAAVLQEIFAGKNLLEVACGTGYWTEQIAQTAGSVFATDINEAVVEIARQKQYPNNNVTFGVADLYEFQPERQYDCLFGGFIWSHIPLEEMERFIKTMNRFVVPGGTMVFMDNRFVAGSNIPVEETDEQGNTYQLRKLEDGTTHRVLKNFPAESQLQQQLSGFSEHIRIVNLTYYWIVMYTVPANQ
jgi:ubiquinone/menaquinone biosynthesis C-methylase UbiE